MTDRLVRRWAPQRVHRLLEPRIQVPGVRMVEVGLQIAHLGEKGVEVGIRLGHLGGDLVEPVKFGLDCGHRLLNVLQHRLVLGQRRLPGRHVAVDADRRGEEVAAGAGVGRDASGRVIFVPFTAPGDKVRVEIVSEEKRYADGRLLVCNRRYAELYGLSPEVTAPGTPILVHPHKEIGRGDVLLTPDAWELSHLLDVRRSTGKTNVQFAVRDDDRVLGGNRRGVLRLGRRPLAVVQDDRVHRSVEERRRIRCRGMAANDDGDPGSELTDVAGMTVRATVGNILNARHRLVRTVYDGRRNTDPVAFVQDNNQLIGPIFSLSVRGNF